MQVHLPDGTALELPDGATGLDVAQAIGPRLATATAAVEVDGELRDLRLPVPDGAHVARSLRVGDAEALAVLRHSTAHVLAEAARHVFPGVKVAIGPAIDDGFYYDFEFPEPVARGRPRSASRTRCGASSRREHAVHAREVVDRDDARARFDGRGRAVQGRADRRPARRARRSRSTRRTTSSTSAAARTCRPRRRSRPSS